MKLIDVAEGFLLARRGELAPTTITNYRYALDKLIAYFGEDTIFPEISAADIQAFIDHLHGSHLAKRSVYGHYVVCSILWGFAHKELNFPHVVRQVPKPKFQASLIEPF